MEKRTRLVQFNDKKRADIDTEFSLSEHEEVIQLSEDVPETRPLFPFPINRVGITGKTVWIKLPQGLIPFDAEIFVDLPEDYKGIHMSRMEQAISRLSEKPFENICKYCNQLANEVLEKQKGGLSLIKLKGKLPRTFTTVISNEASSDSVDVRAETVISLKDGTFQETHTVGLGLTHITACPCTQVYNRGLFKKEKAAFPHPTHSQRCITWLEIESDKAGTVSFEDLFCCLASSLHLSQDLLKRPDEAELVLKSHRQPQFAEDVVRSVAMRTGHYFKKRLPGKSLVRIRSTSFESIHRHNVSCILEATLGEIINKL